MKDQNFKPGSKEAWMRGCKGCQGDWHQEGCILWAKSPIDGVSPMGQSPIPLMPQAAAQPKGCDWIPLYYKDLQPGDLYIQDMDYKNYAQGTNGKWPHAGIFGCLTVGLHIPGQKMVFFSANGSYVEDGICLLEEGREDEKT